MLPEIIKEKQRDAAEMFAVVLIVVLLFGFNLFWLGWIFIMPTDITGIVLTIIIMILVSLLMLFVEGVILISTVGIN